MLWQVKLGSYGRAARDLDGHLRRIGPRACGGHDQYKTNPESSAKERGIPRQNVYLLQVSPGILLSTRPRESMYSMPGLAG